MASTPTISSPQHLLHEAEKAAAAILSMTATQGRRLSHIRGVHGRRRAGDGDSFWQYRQYIAGDSAQLIDWRRSARSNHIYVREQEWETAQNIYFWVDASPSMIFSSSPQTPTKLTRSKVISLALAIIFSQGGERVSLIAQKDTTPRAGRFGINQMAENLYRLENTPTRFERLKLGHGSHLVLISDFLDPIEQLKAQTAPLLAQGTSGHLIRVLDSCEEEFPFSGRIEFEGLEGEGREILERTEDLRDAYQQRMAALSISLAEWARHQGWSFSTHRSDHPTTPCLLAATAHIAQPRGAY